jgi:hypothetical protein
MHPYDEIGEKTPFMEPCTNVRLIWVTTLQYLPSVPGISDSVRGRALCILLLCGTMAIPGRCRFRETILYFYIVTVMSGLRDSKVHSKYAGHNGVSVV